MKKLITTLLFACAIAYGLHAQINPAKKAVKKPVSQTTAKVYSIGLAVDSTGLVQLKQAFVSLYNDLDNSNIPHDKVKQHQAFINNLWQSFDAEKNAQDAAYKARQDSINKSKVK